jgi:hypothetical protein
MTRMTDNKKYNNNVGSGEYEKNIGKIFGKYE